LAYGKKYTLAELLESLLQPYNFFIPVPDAPVNRPNCKGENIDTDIPQAHHIGSCPFPDLRAIDSRLLARESSSEHDVFALVETRKRK